LLPGEKVGDEVSEKEAIDQKGKKREEEKEKGKTV
jgi:hypothetical protein